MRLISTARSTLLGLPAAALLGAVLPACTLDKELTTGTLTDSTAVETTADSEPTLGATGPLGTTAETEGDTSGTTGPADTTLGTTGPDDTSTGTTGPADNDDFAMMEECALPAVCEPFTHLVAEGDPYHPNQEPFLPGEVCVWTGLRDGTPGRYTYTTDHEFGNGHEDVVYLIHVHADRKVTFATFAELSLEFEGNSSSFGAAQTCTLADPGFFDACATDTDVHFECAWTTQWWTDCVEEGPKCE